MRDSLELSSAFLHFAPLMMLLAIRVGVTLALLPAPFGSTTPVQIRMAIGLFIAWALTLPNMHLTDSFSLNVIALLRGGLGEMLIGMLIGLTVRCVFAATEIAGTAAGFSMGLGFATSIDPTFGETNLPTSRIFNILAVVIFLVLSGHHVVLEALQASIVLAPPGNTFATFASGGVLRVSTQMITQALRIAAPVVATMFIVQLGTGLASRAAPRVQIFAMSFAIATAAGLLTLYIAASSIATAIGVQIQGLPYEILRALRGA
ncbi:MAG: flagellar biosynthetic protein FliR [Myxococcota bacterium]